MSRMRRWAAALGNLAVSAVSLLVCLLALEGLLRLLPIAAAPRVHPATDDDPVVRYEANASFSWSQGWALDFPVRGRTNAQGFVADYDYARSGAPLLAVIGDSYVEALQVPFRASLTGRLDEALAGRGRAYAFAQSGLPLSQYVAYAEHACRTYRPERVAVVVVGNDFDESVYEHRVRSGVFHLRKRPDGGLALALTPLPPPSLAEKIARNSALALYLVRNLHALDTIRRLGIRPAQAGEGGTAHVGNTAADTSEARLTEGRAVIDWFLGAMPSASCLPPQDIAIVVDAARPHVYDPAHRDAARRSYFGIMRSELISRAAAAGFKVVDLEPVFSRAYAREQRRFEFPADAHWNDHGHAVVAEALRNAMRDWPPLASD